MKRALLSLLILALLPALCGCAGIYANTREVEQLLVIQTMGLDAADAGVNLSLASGAGVQAAGSPSRLHGSAASITSAIEQIRSLANEDDIFCSHISHVLIGEAAARQGIGSYLAYICRSPELRISVPLYVVRGATAEEAVLGVGNENYGICDALDSVDSDLRMRGDGHIFTAADIAGALARNGSALICAVEYAPSAEQNKVPVTGGGEEGGAQGGEQSGEQSGDSGQQQIMTVAAVGYGVLKDEQLCAFIDRGLAVAVGFLLDDVGPCELVVRDRTGNPVTLEINQGSSELRALWSESGELAGLDISVTVSAAVAEAREGDAAYEDELTARLETALSERIRTVLQLSRSLGADFLGLGSRIERADTRRFRAMDKPFSELLPKLTIQLSVSGRIDHTNDIRDEAL